jgi:YD repeat-containing protein
MNDKYNLSEFGSLRRILSLVAVALALAGPPRLWGQSPCIPGEAPFPTAVSVTVTPAVIVSGQLVTLTATITLNSEAGFGNGALGIDVQYATTGYTWLGDVFIPCKQNSATVSTQITAPGETQPTTMTVTARIYGASGSGNFVVIPAGQPASPANLGQCKQCQQHAGAPVNLTEGNVWIQQRDYSVPGLGGGLELSRTWNSRWMYATPPTLAGMFGSGWRSTFEEQLMPLSTDTLIYWRGDGSGWTFTYNSALNSYLLSSPPDERAQLMMNPATSGFTLTFADGTQKVFNGQGLLAAVVDRNNNQTTLAYDWSNRLTSVTSPGGSTLTFTYGDPNNPLQVTTAQDSVGTVATYTYDSSSRLTKVTYPDGSALNFTLDPNSSMILSVTDSQGKLIESHTYDAQNRGLTSSQAYGVNSVSLSY